MLSTHWHKESYDRFLNDTLPTLLARRLDLKEYSVAITEGNSCRVTLTVEREAVPQVQEGLPYPDASGVFLLAEESAERLCVVVPIATSEDLESAEILCVGELLRDDIAARLERWSGSVLPLTEWLLDFFDHSPQAQILDTTNFIARTTHCRRIRVEGQITGFHPSLIGRVCPIETPEGPNIGRFLVIARGAAIENGKMVVQAASPAAGVGVAASLIPFLAHSEPARTLMGANMIRQWHPLPEAEPPLVQTGQEPESIPEQFWCGVNLLTAFVFWGSETHEEGLILSESAARRLGYPYPLEAGDKLSNRHGSKGVVSRILPDAEMPHLPDGTATEIIYTFFSLPSRMNHGQLLEAALGRIAKVEGKPAIAPLYAGPTVEEMQARLSAVGIAPSGLERLSEGKEGTPLERESAVGYVYWGRTHHDARAKVGITTGDAHIGQHVGQHLGLTEYHHFAEKKAWATLKAFYREQAVEQDGWGFPIVQQRLAALGIQAVVTEKGLTFAWNTQESTDAITLAVPVPHPWQSAQMLTHIAPADRPEAFQSVREANDRLFRMQQSNAPARLVTEGIATLRQRIRAFADVLLGTDAFAPDVRVRWSARAVIAPGADLTPAQIGLPEQIADALFGGDGISEADRDARMEKTWILVNRKPTLYSTSLIAFRPVLRSGSVVRLNPLACNWLEADFDGDQVALYLPQSDEAQREAGEILSVRAQLARDPSRLSAPYGGLLPGHGVVYGLAELARTEEGRKTIAAVLQQTDLSALPYLTRQPLVTALAELLQSQGPDATLTALQELARLGFAASQRSGASLSPFIGADLTLPPQPDDADLEAWDAYGEEMVELLNARAARGEFSDDDLGPSLLAAVSGARGRTLFLAKLLGSVSPGWQWNPWGKAIPMPHGWREGLTQEELVTVAGRTRIALRRLYNEQPRVGEDGQTAPPSQALTIPGNSILARALRAKRPGIIFASAATTGEVDPLSDPYSQLFVG